MQTICSSSGQELRLFGGVKEVGPNPFFTPISTPDLWGQLQREAWNMLRCLLPKVCLVFSHPHPNMSECVEPFLSDFLKHLKHMVLTQSGQPHRKRTPHGISD